MVDGKGLPIGAEYRLILTGSESFLRLFLPLTFILIVIACFDSPPRVIRRLSKRGQTRIILLTQSSFHTRAVVNSLIKMHKLQTLTDTPCLTKVLKALKNQAQIYMVGGAVRDALLGEALCDFDLACSLPPLDAKALLEQAGIRVVPTGIEHGTITAVVEKAHVEITTFRSPSSRIATRYGESIEEDLEGRDFTINALAYDFLKDRLIDPFGGLEDLNNRILRGTCSPLARFQEDPLRILRMLRFGPAQRRQIDQQTLEAAVSIADSLASVSVERVRDEFCKILLSPDPSVALRTARDSGLLQHLLPELLPAVDCEQNSWHIEDVFEHTLSVLSRTPPELLLRLTAIFHDIGKPLTVSLGEDGERHFYQHEHVGAEICSQTMKRLRFSNELTESTSLLVDYHMRPLSCSPATVRRLMRDLGPLLPEWRRFKHADKSPTLSEDEFFKEAQVFDTMLSEELSRKDLEQRSKLTIDGHDLMHLGIPKGPQMGMVIKRLKELILDSPELNIPETLQAEAVKIFAELTS
jgi:tRNA nucleotidyltransferase (CCA-adding enzyme)